MTHDDFDSTYKLNHDYIDYQHWKVFEHMQTILDYYSRDHDKKILSELIDKFEKYVDYHFNYEVDMMKRSGYNLEQSADYNSHVLEHLYTLIEIRGFGLRHRIEFPDPYPVEFVVDILKKHVITFDKKFITWLKSKELQN